MGKILCFDWLLERVCLVQSGFPALFPQEVVFWSLIIKPLLTKREIKVAGSWPCFTYLRCVTEKALLTMWQKSGTHYQTK